jgi:hypothetical protein
LRPEDLRRIEKGLKRGPEALGYETSLWTAWRVAHLIEQECGVKYHPVQAWRILRKPNFCPQNFGQLGDYARKALRRMRKRPSLVIAFWRQAELLPL